MMKNIINKLLNARYIIALITTLIFGYLCITGNKDILATFITVYMVILGYFFTASKKEEGK